VINGAVEVLNILRSRGECPIRIVLHMLFSCHHLTHRKEGCVCYQQCDKVQKELQEEVRSSGLERSCGTQSIRLSTPEKPRTLVFQDEIYGSAYAAAVYISSVVKLPKDKKVYVIGQSGLEEELQDEGVSFIGGTVSLILSIGLVPDSLTLSGFKR
jgi:hypothetical protein